MIPSLPALASWANFVLIILTMVVLVAGSVLVIRSTITKTQADIITAYEKKDRLMTEKVAKLEAVLLTVQIALKRQGIEITIEDDTVTMRQTGVRKTTVVRVKRDTGPGGSSP